MKFKLITADNTEEWKDIYERIGGSKLGYTPTWGGEGYAVHITEEDEHYKNYCSDCKFWSDKGNHEVIKYKDWIDSHTQFPTTI